MNEYTVRNMTPEELRRMQLIQTDLLEEVDRICLKHGIHYSVEGGTLLGAIRHKGFIPWDDDVDIAMLRPEYEKFCQVCENEINKEKYFFQNHTTDTEYRWGYAKVLRKNTSFTRYGQEHMKMRRGVYVEIFPMDGIPENFLARKIYNFTRLICRKIMWSEVGKLQCRSWFLRSWFSLLNKIPVEKAFSMLDKLSKKYSVEKSEYVTCLSFPDCWVKGYFQLARLSEKSEEKEYIRQHISDFESIYNKLQDEKSKLIYRCILNYRITNNILYLKEMSSYIDSEENQYFDNILLEQYYFETGFVDAGAYTGDTLSQMHKNLPDFSGEYYAFEAGKDIYIKLLSNCDTENYGFKVTCFNIAVWNEEGSLRFDTSENDAGSKVNEEGEVVFCNSLDNLLKNCKVDFIKMDIEGSERKALEGAVGIIRNNKPIMAICIYHKREDFYDIPQLIESIIPNEYAFYIRQYRFGQSETVLYALPNSRKKILK